MKKTALAISLALLFSVNARAESTPASDDLGGVKTVAPEVKPVSGKTNPFTGKTAAQEKSQKDLDAMRIRSQILQEQVKMRKDEIELERLNAPKPVEKPVKAEKPESASATVKAKKKKSTAKSSASIDGEEAAPVKPEKPKEPIAWFAPSKDKNLSAPKLIGILQVDDRKVAVLSFNGVVVRILEGDALAGRTISSAGNGRVMWGNQALYTTEFVNGARITLTETAPASKPASPIQTAQAQPALQPTSQTVPAPVPGSGLQGLRLPPPPPVGRY